ncbi:hypothetical protein OBK23_03225 [Empedobacter falsenii]|uniref:hypothetical protein n=1 Tax=Empedobacter falsenii TaxID=343874 RepID=UPI003A810045
MKNDSSHIYSYRAVAFLDVLGFQNKLSEFENEAIEFHNNFQDDDEFASPYYYSKKADEFIETFNTAISKLDTNKFSYYLFSDNICITANNTYIEGESTLIELLLIISELYFEFVQKGYFLRGGIDYGLFIDQASVALGVPLATAYKMESYLAVFPRIILSDSFVNQLQVYLSEDEKKYQSLLAENLILKSCEIKYLNIFNHIFKVDDKEYYFELFSSNISENIIANKNKESIFLKYKWLADEFNNFIEQYTSELAYYDDDIEVTEEHLNTVKKFAINYGQ